MITIHVLFYDKCKHLYTSHVQYTVLQDMYIVYTDTCSVT